MPPKKNDFEEYKHLLASLGRNNLTPPLKEETLADLVKEGMDILRAEQNKSAKVSSPKTTVAPKTPSKNPYQRAHDTLLAEMPVEKRNVIEKMEAGTLPKDSRYDMFVKEIIKLGDQF